MIGGEFEIDLSLAHDDFVAQPEMHYYASGRVALYQILKSLGNCKHKIWLPNWLCHTIIDSVEKAKYDYKFYELDNQFKATIEALRYSGFNDGDIVLIINYFGLQRLTESAKSIKETFPKAVVIEDDVQAYWEFAEQENPYADYRFTSLRKAFPIPDGGLVYTKQPMPKVFGVNTFAPLKFQAGVMKRMRILDGSMDEEYLTLFRQGEALIPENYESIMSYDSTRMFAGIDFQQVKKTRKINTQYLLKGLTKIGIKPLIEVPLDSVPLFVPIYLENRDEVRRRMFQNSVFCPVHWSLGGMTVGCGAEMARHELSLICDERYGEEDMDLIVSLIK